MPVDREMPRYKCHKEVWALKIKSIFTTELNGGKIEMSFEDDNYAPIIPSGDYLTKHSPEPGGYYVVYADGYKSYSPAKAFEEGYTLVE